MHYWILNPDHSVRPAKDNEEYYAWLMSIDPTVVMRVASTQIDGDCWVSTVFLHGIDHNWAPGHDPILFETMVFGGKHDGEMTRYCTWEEAEQGHNWIVHSLMGQPAS